MSIVNADAKSLEVYCAAYLSQDSILLEELFNDLDMHSLNQEAFGLPSRLIAKILVFRILYGGTGYSFANDPDFADVSKSERFWNNKIEAFYNKYKGIQQWHTKIVQEVTTTGKLVVPGTQRQYEFKRTQRGDWPVTTIKNYPVQGLGADIMAIARVSFARRFKESGIDGIMVNTVHDSIVCDVASRDVERTAEMFYAVFDDLPANFEKLFKKEFKLPLKCEVSVGMNMADLEEIKRAKTN